MEEMNVCPHRCGGRRNECVAEVQWKKLMCGQHWYIGRNECVPSIGVVEEMNVWPAMVQWKNECVPTIGVVEEINVFLA